MSKDTNNPLYAFKDFIFTDRIRDELLELFIEGAPNVICFHGKPGIGKTSFANAFVESVANPDRVFRDAMNEIRSADIKREYLDASGIGKALSVTLDDFMPESQYGMCRYERVWILDEFHNLSPQAQDKYKIRMEEIGDDELIVVILNTTDNKGIREQLTPAIYSRLHCIDMDIKRRELEEMTAKVAARYPDLRRAHIKATLPDMRRLVREGEFAKTVKEKKDKLREQLAAIEGDL